MKQAWYFTRWMIAKCGWSELLFALLVFTAMPAFFSSTPAVRDLFQYINLVTLTVFLLTIIYSCLQFFWRQFKAEQEKMFDVLKKEEK